MAVDVRRLRPFPRGILAATLVGVTACGLAYDVDSLESSTRDCGKEGAPCCEDARCESSALSCVDQVCERCAGPGAPCCLSRSLDDCGSEGGLAGTCDAANRCILSCTQSATACAALPSALCCGAASNCNDCQASNSCLCKVCCVKCGDNAYQAVDIAPGTACAASGMAACGASYQDAYWSTTSC